jgi:hypothetical protein
MDKKSPEINQLSRQAAECLKIEILNKKYFYFSILRIKIHFLIKIFYF